MTVDTLRSRLARGETLTEEEAISLEQLLTFRCGGRTRSAVARGVAALCERVRAEGSIDSYGIYGRVHLKSGEARYCAGQSYPDEIRTLRSCVIAEGGVR